MHRHGHVTRRSLLRTLLGAWAGASLAEVSLVRAAVATAQSAAAPAKLFDIRKVAEGIYSAVARPAAMINCNSAIFEQAQDLVIVDTHSKPSAAAALVAQIHREVSAKPVRYIVNTHFHWDHSQGNAAYSKAFPKADIVASGPTKQAIEHETEKRLKIQLEEDVPRLLAEAEKERSDARSDAERAFHADQIRQLQDYRSEMKNFELALPTITFENTYVIRDDMNELQLSFHGRAHTAGDVVVFSPRSKVIATGDLIHGFFPYIGDGFPTEWPAAIGSVTKLDFATILPGHGPVQTGRKRVANFRAYLEEITARVAEGKKAGKTVADLQQTITARSLKSLAADGYGDFLAANNKKYRATFGEPAPLQESVNQNIEHVCQNLDRR